MRNAHISPHLERKRIQMAHPNRMSTVSLIIFFKKLRSTVDIFINLLGFGRSAQTRLFTLINTQNGASARLPLSSQFRGSYFDDM
jgi:hypothetical protein